MSSRAEHEQEKEQLSGSEEDEDFLDEDIKALRRACLLTGTNPDDIYGNNLFTSSAAAPTYGDYSAAADDTDSDDDLELVRNIKNRFSVPSDLHESLSLNPLASLPPAASDEDDDFETLLAIQRRFSVYDSDISKHGTRDSLKKPEQVHASSLSLEKETTDNLFVNRTNACEGFTDSEDFVNSRSLGDNVGVQPSGFIEKHQSEACKSSMLPLKKSCFPKSALFLMDAIKKNRSNQKFLRSKLIELEARIEENKKLRERVKILKDFQASCRKRTGRALSQKKDHRVQLISAKKSWASKDPKIIDKRVSAMYYGPVENSHVANYRIAITNFPLTLDRKKWSMTERENLGKGITQQFQEMVLRISVDRFSGSQGSSGHSDDFDKILVSIKDLEVTPEHIREFLPKINWEQLASMYVVGRSGAECEARWLNHEDPLINHNPWTAKEDKNLLLLVQEKGINNWFDIAVSMGTNRTPFQCLARYQRSLNASVLKREWTKDEDAQLRAAIEVFGESDWQSVASTLEGRAGNQCSNRWKKSLHPTRERVGRWSADEDKHLKVAVMLFGAKNWNKIAQFVPGRTQVQCRERWVNSLDPSLNWGEWTEEEDSRLKAAIVEHGYCWSKIAACVPPRTDNQCRRRWKVLLPHEVPLLREAKRIQKAALISNFVDRESERPALSSSDFLPLQMISATSNLENEDRCCKRKGRLGNASRKIRSKKSEQHAQPCSGDTQKRKYPKSHSRRKKCMEPVADNLSLVLLPESLQSGTINGDCTEATVDNCSASNRKRSSKHYSRRNSCTADVKGNMNSTWSSGKSLLSGITNDSEHPLDHVSCPDSTLLTITNGEVVDSADGHVCIGQKRPSTLHSEKEKCMELAEDSHSFSSYPESLEFRENDGEHVRSSSLDKEMENTGLKLQNRKKRKNERSGKLPSVSIPCQQDGPKISNVSSKEILGTRDGDDITLACFLSYKSKKRRLGAAKRSNEACFPSSLRKIAESRPNEVLELHDGNQIPSVTQDMEPEACCHAGNPDNSLPCKLKSSLLEDMPTVIDGVNGPGRQDTDQQQNGGLHEPVSINLEGTNEEDGNVTLACFIRNKSRKGQLAKTAKTKQ